MQDLWLPEGGRYIRTTPLGRNKETGGTITSNEMEVQFTDQFGKLHKQLIFVLSDEFTSQTEIEDQMGYATENYIRDAKQKYNKRPATRGEMKEAGHALEDFRKQAVKRLKSTNRKIHY